MAPWRNIMKYLFVIAFLMLIIAISLSNTSFFKIPLGVCLSLLLVAIIIDVARLIRLVSH
jgi:hypothetical protein